VSENRALRKLFRSKRDEVTVDWRRLHNEELHDCTAHIIVGIKLGRIRWVEHVPCTEEKSIYDSGRKHVGKKPLGRQDPRSTGMLHETNW
jgi:hypothetical protein